MQAQFGASLIHQMVDRVSTGSEDGTAILWGRFDDWNAC